MPKFRVVVSHCGWDEYVVEADSPEKAEELVMYNPEGQELTPVKSETVSQEIDVVEEVEADTKEGGLYSS